MQMFELREHMSRRGVRLDQSPICISYAEIKARKWTDHSPKPESCQTKIKIHDARLSWKLEIFCTLPNIPKVYMRQVYMYIFA